MFVSTDSKSGIDPVYGEPGVDSSMYLPYSGWKVGTVMLRDNFITALPLRILLLTWLVYRRR
jgi:hypothetical protein